MQMSETTGQSSAARKLGIIAAPGWFDPTQGEFAQRHLASELAITQTIMPPVGFGWSFDEIAGSEANIASAARLLAEAGSELIIEVGPAFAYLIGGDPQGAKALQQRLSDTCRVPVILNGVAVFDALDAVGAKRIAIACPYYSPAWKAKLTDYMQRTQYNVAGFATFVELSLFASQADVDARHYSFSPGEVQEAIRGALAAAPDAEAVMIGGSGVRTLDWVEDLEAELGVPLVSADRSLYSATVKALGLAPKVTLK
jgi:maleate cis-trans isomerase